MRGENRAVNTFDELWYSRHHSHKLKFDLERFPCASRLTRLHIQRAYNHRMLARIIVCIVLSLQQKKKMCDLDPNLYSYEFND